jgi:hypothetical protein
MYTILVLLHSSQLPLTTDEYRAIAHLKLVSISHPSCPLQGRILFLETGRVVQTLPVLMGKKEPASLGRICTVPTSRHNFAAPFRLSWIFKQANGKFLGQSSENTT